MLRIAAAALVLATLIASSAPSFARPGAYGGHGHYGGLFGGTSRRIR